MNSIHGNTILKNQDMETIKVSINEETDKKNVKQTMKYYSTLKMKEVLPFVTV
jgi:hypothetical protein